jgi:hypothetical protein
MAGAAVFGDDKRDQSCYNGPTNLVKDVQDRWPRSVSPQVMAAQRLAAGDGRAASRRRR